MVPEGGRKKKGGGGAERRDGRKMLSCLYKNLRVVMYLKEKERDRTVPSGVWL